MHSIAGLRVQPERGQGHHAPARAPTMAVQRPSTRKLRRSLFEEATAIVGREYAADLSLDDVARRVATSRRQLQRAFQEVGDTTFREHLTAVRMDRAAELLRHAPLTVREVAHRVGYRQPAQFAKAFRRRHGVAPSEYRTAERRFTRPAGNPMEHLRPEDARPTPATY